MPSRVTTTDLHDWEFPLTGYNSDIENRPYGDIFEVLIEDYLDDGIPVIDEEAARDQYPPKAGARFLASDTGKRFLGDGNQWQVWPFPGEDPPPPPASTYEAGGAEELTLTGLSGKLNTPQTPEHHVTKHQSGGVDELNVTGLTGTLATPQPPESHATSHAAGGSDPLTLTGLPGDLADPQDPKPHVGDHQNGGVDELNVGGLSGTLADPQPPQAHSSSHAAGAVDELDVTGLSGRLAEPQPPVQHGDEAHSETYTKVGHTHGQGDLTFDPVTQAELDERLVNQRAFTITSGSDEEYFKLATISSGGSTRAGDIYVRTIGGTPTNPADARSLNFYSSVGNSNEQTGWYVEGNGTSRFELLLVREDGGTESDIFHLYAVAPSFVTCNVVVNYSNQVPDVSLTAGLTETDVTSVGTIEHSTADAPIGYHSFGRLYDTGRRVVTQPELTTHTNTPDAHHTRYTDSEAVSAVEGTVDVASLTSGSATAGLVPKADGTGGVAWEAEETGGTPDETDLATYTSESAATGGLAPLSDGTGGVGWQDVATQSELDTHAGVADAHHARYTDSESVQAVEDAGTIGVSITGDAASVGGLERGEFARNTRTFRIDSASGLEYYKIGKISDGGSFEQGRFDATLYFATDNGNAATRCARVFGAARTSSYSLQAITYGPGQPGNEVDLIVTETAGTGQGGENEYYLWVRAKDYSKTDLEIKHADIWGSFDFQEGLTEADLLGTIVADSGSPNAEVALGDLTAANTIDAADTRSDFAVTKQTIEVDETKTVPADHSAVVAGEYTVDGTLVINGTFTLV